MPTRSDPGPAVAVTEPFDRQSVIRGMQACIFADPTDMDPADLALGALLHVLRARGYHFVTPTPATHRLVIGRPDRREARRLEDALGWSLPFRDGLLDREVMDLLETAGALRDAGAGLRRSIFRVSSLKGELFVHSAFPTDDQDAVFFGPDSYRFANLITAELRATAPKADARIVDMGTGAGVGAIVAHKISPTARLFMTDINPSALRLARVNADAAAVPAQFVEGDGLAEIGDPIDLILANPPYIIDPEKRAYRNGGALHGGAVALDMARQALDRLASGGRLILYTGTAIVDGVDILGNALAELAEAKGCALSYRELDPDVFGDELANDAYRDVDRIAVVGAVFRR